MVAGALSIALVSYSISMKVSAERKAVERIVRENTVLTAELERLDAELRVRMRLPQLERWNSQVLGLRPIAATQFLGDPLLLADYGTPLAEAPPPTLAIARDLPAPAAPPAAAITRVSAPAPTPAPVPQPAVASSPKAPPAPVQTAEQASPGLDAALVAAIEALAAEARQPKLTTVAMERSAPPAQFGGIAPPGAP